MAEWGNLDKIFNAINGTPKMYSLVSNGVFDVVGIKNFTVGYSSSLLKTPYNTK